MPSTGLVSCHLAHRNDPSLIFDHLPLSQISDKFVVAHIPIDTNPHPSCDYGPNDTPYAIHWSLDPSLLQDGGLLVQVEVDGCQKGQPRCYEQLAPHSAQTSLISGVDDGLWVVPDGTRRRPWVLGPIKTTHPHSALADKCILDRVGSVSITFRRAKVVPTSHVVPLVPVFSGGAPLPDRMRARLSHWTRLGFIEKHDPPPELGLVSEEEDEILASFLFYYRSRELLKHLTPSHLRAPTPTPCSPPDVKISFPTASDAQSVRSEERMSSCLSDSHSPPRKPGRPATGIRRALSAVNNARHSTDGMVLSPENLEKEEGGGKFGKLGTKRVRAVSLKVVKRYSLLGHKSGEKSPLKNSGDGASPPPPAPNDDEAEVDTIQSLKSEILGLKLEVSNIKKHLNL